MHKANLVKPVYEKRICQDLVGIKFFANESGYEIYLKSELAKSLGKLKIKGAFKVERERKGKNLEVWVDRLKTCSSYL